MAKIVIALACCILAVVAEPPVGVTGEGFSSAQLEADSLSTQYGAPQGQFAGGAAGGFAGRHGQHGGQHSRPGAGHRHGGSPSSQYGVPFNGYADEGNEPANYEFHYEVEDRDYGVKFGHMESRQGDLAVGSYNVLLPDGRTQLVEYEADQDGYRPKISYTGGSEGGYGRGPAQGGYPRGGQGGSGNY